MFACLLTALGNINKQMEPLFCIFCFTMQLRCASWHFCRLACRNKCFVLALRCWSYALTHTFMHLVWLGIPSCGSVTVVLFLRSPQKQFRGNLGIHTTEMSCLAEYTREETVYSFVGACSCSATHTVRQLCVITKYFLFLQTYITLN